MKEESLIVGAIGLDNLNENLPSIPFSSLISNKLNFHGKQAAQIDGVTRISKNFQELRDEAKVLAAAVQELGVSAGKTIAIACENRLEYGVVMISCMFNGTVFAPINPTYSPGEIVHVLNISNPCVVFCSAITLKNVSLSVPKLKGKCRVVLFDNIDHESLAPVIYYKSLLQTSPIKKLYETKDEEVAVILTSSGTTGLPKGVMLSYANLRYFCSCAMSSTFLDLQPRDVILGLLPLYHGYGYGLLLSSLLIGIKFVLLPKFEDRLFLSTVENFKITNLYLVPPLMVFLGKHPLVTQYDLSSVKEVVCGAAPLSTDVTEQVQVRMPGVDVRQGYGMTELSVVITISPPHSNKPHSVGKLAAGVQAKVVDVESGKTLPRGQQGEILVRGPCVMTGYCNDPEAMRSIIDSDGWVHTGDVGYVDNEGFFYIIDRIKELIKYKGFQVAPAELESLLLGMSGVRDAGVVGVPDLTAGELPVAYVVLQPNSTLTDSSILDYVNSKVSPHKRLRGVRFIESIPRNPSGKILRRLLRNKVFSSKL